jgi:dynein heavy chain
LILNQIADNDKNLLEDDLLIATLDDSKAQCKAIEVKQEESKNTLEHINRIREQFEQVARRVARLFFVLMQIMNVNPMYQYSLEFFKNIYLRALKNGDHIEKGKKNDRKNFFIKEFTSLLYDNICRSLYEKDKLLFSFLICIKIMDEVEGGVNPQETRFLMTGGTRVEMSKPNPSNGWLTDKAWASILQISEEFAAFKGLDTNFEKNLDEWERIYNSAKPQSKKANWPEPFNGLSYIQQAMFLRVFRSDKVIPVIQNLIKKEKEMGKPYIIPPPFDMDKSYQDSANNVPIIIVLSAGADPMNELNKLAKIRNATIKVISLGQGQSKIACDAIEMAQEMGQWVVL